MDTRDTRPLLSRRSRRGSDAVTLADAGLRTGASLIVRRETEGRIMRLARALSGTVAALSSLLLVADASGAVAAGTKTVKIGLLASLSGYVASYGTDERDGALLAINEINKSNAIPGVTLQPIVLDDKGDPTAAVEAAQQAIDQGAIAILGPTTTAGTAALASIATARQVPDISFGLLPVAPHAKPPAYAYSLSIEPNDEAVGDLDAALAGKNVKTIALIYDSNAYGQSISDGIKREAAAKGIRTVASEAFKSTSTDMTPQLTAIRSAKPDAIIDVGGGTTPGLIARQMYELGMHQKLVISAVSFGIGAVKFAQIAGPNALSNVRHTAFAEEVWNTLPKADPRYAKLQAVIPAFRKAYGHDPNGYGAAAAYDAAWVLADAIKRADSVDSKKIQAALDQTKYQGTLCLAQFSPDSHSACHSDSLVVSKLAGGKLVYGD
ncbi:hypothetical protein EPN52_13240 [bacterium]|nr:MAG: hypothetical protein EPN52_13240 [bacterium]